MAALPHLPLMSVEEYLNTSFADGDREFVDGVVLEREVGTPWHSILQGILVEYLRRFQKSLRVQVLPECRTKISETRFRIPDVSVMLRPFRQNGRVVLDPPFLVVEVLSPADRVVDVLARFHEYAALGVQHIVLMDPEEDRAFLYLEESLERRDLTGFEIADRGLLPFNTHELFGLLAEERGEGCAS